MLIWFLSSVSAQESAACEITLDTSFMNKGLEHHVTSTPDGSWQTEEVKYHPIFSYQEIPLQFPIFDFDILHVSPNIQAYDEENPVVELLLKSSQQGLLQKRRLDDSSPEDFFFSLSPGQHQIQVQAKTFNGQFCSAFFRVDIQTKPTPTCLWKEINGQTPIAPDEDSSYIITPPPSVEIKMDKSTISRLITEVRYEGDRSDIEIQIVDETTAVLYEGPTARDGVHVLELNALTPPKRLALNARSKNGKNCSQTLIIDPPDPVSETRYQSSGFYGFDSGEQRLTQVSFDLDWYFKGGHNSASFGISQLQTFGVIPFTQKFPAGYVAGVSFGLAGTSQYQNENFFAHIGINNGLNIGPLYLLTGGGIGTASWNLFDIESGQETRLFLQDTPGYWYWNNRILLSFGDDLQYGFQGSYEPRWYMQEDQLINRSMWSAELVLGVLRVGYEQWYMPDDSIMAVWNIALGSHLNSGY